MTTPKVYIIILNYNQWKDTLACVESVLQSDYENYSVVAIDNNSPNDSRQNLLAGIGRLASEKKKLSARYIGNRLRA